MNWLLVTVTEYFVTYEHGCVPFVVVTILSFFMTYHQIFNKSITASDTIRVENAYLFGRPALKTGF